MAAASLLLLVALLPAALARYPFDDVPTAPTWNTQSTTRASTRDPGTRFTTTRVTTRSTPAPLQLVDARQFLSPEVCLEPFRVAGAEIGVRALPVEPGVVKRRYTGRLVEADCVRNNATFPCLHVKKCVADKRCYKLRQCRAGDLGCARLEKVYCSGLDTRTDNNEDGFRDIDQPNFYTEVGGTGSVTAGSQDGNLRRSFRMKKMEYLSNSTIVSNGTIFATPLGGLTFRARKTTGKNIRYEVYFRPANSTLCQVPMLPAVEEINGDVQILSAARFLRSGDYCSFEIFIRDGSERDADPAAKAIQTLGIFLVLDPSGTTTPSTTTPSTSQNPSTNSIGQFSTAVLAP
eukprot:m.132993 g.132993  ORF g.132993 m.132993 type:complete len:347 (-) comp20085_c0_seq1:113-1153(-)